VNHPNALRLEAFACGEPAPAVEEHVRLCEACRAFLERVRSVAAQPPPISLPRILEAAPKTTRRRPSIPLAASVALPLVAAALLWVSPWARTRDNAGTPRILPPAANPLAATADPDTTFKGGLQVSVVRERAGTQERFAGEVRVRPGDRLRIEVALDRPQAVEGAIVGDDGSFLEMMTAEVRSAGTHFSEKAARIDAQPLHGTILVGPPEAVGRARGGGAASDVAKLRVEWEPLP
jgi:hypothetical protein